MVTQSESSVRVNIVQMCHTFHEIMCKLILKLEQEIFTVWWNTFESNVFIIIVEKMEFTSVWMKFFTTWN